MKKGKLKKILASSAMGIMALAMPFALTGCEKDSDINVRVDGDYIQWQVEGDSSWTNLLSIDEVKDLLGDSCKGEQGIQGNPGINGREVEFRKTETYIQWRYVDNSQEEDENWENIIAISELQVNGDNGETPFIGENGNWWIDETDTGVKAEGVNGKTPTITISDDGYWVINGEKQSVKAEGVDGEPGKDLVAEQCVVTYDFNFDDDNVSSTLIKYLQEGMFNQEGFELSLDKSIFDRDNLVLKYTQKYTKGNYFNLYDFGELGFGKYFDGWYYEGLKVDNLRVVAGNIELKAKWNTCITDMIMVKPTTNYNTLEYDFNEDDLTVCIKPSEHYSDDAFISEFVFNDGKFYKVVDFDPYYNGSIVWDTITLPHTLKESCLNNLFVFPNVNYMEILYYSDIVNVGEKYYYDYVGDYVIRPCGNNASLVYKLDWEKEEASLIYVSGRLATNNITDISIEDFEVYKNGVVYDFKVVSLEDGRWLRPKYNFNKDTSKREMLIVLSDNVVNIGDINMTGWEYTEEIPCVINIFIKNKNCIYELDLDNYASLGVNIKLYYYIENEEDVPADGGNYWYYLDGGFPVIWKINETE